MDFDQIETFLEVAKLSSFSRAAERRFRTQPAISSQTRSREEEGGARLLDRSGGRVALTAAGKVFQKYAEETIEQRRVMMVALAEMHRVPRGEIVVAANEGTCLHILPEVFAEFKRQYPNVAGSVKRLEHQKILESLIENSSDFGVVSMPIKDKRYTVVPIHRDELVVITPVNHPLAACPEVALADVAKYPLLLPKLGRTRDALEALFHEHRLKPIVSMELDSSELTKRFVAANVGIGFIPKSNVAEDVKAKVLAALKVSEVTLQRDLALIFRTDKALSRAALAFIEIAVKIKTGTAPPVAARSW